MAIRVLIGTVTDVDNDLANSSWHGTRTNTNSSWLGTSRTEVTWSIITLIVVVKHFAIGFKVATTRIPTVTNRVTLHPSLAIIITALHYQPVQLSNQNCESRPTFNVIGASLPIAIGPSRPDYSRAHSHTHKHPHILNSLKLGACSLAICMNLPGGTMSSCTQHHWQLLNDS